MKHRQLGEIHPVSRCQQDVIGLHPRAIRES